MTTFIILAALLLWATGSLRGQQEPGAQQPPSEKPEQRKPKEKHYGWLVLENLAFARETGRLQIDGRAALPEGTVVHALIHFAGPTTAGLVSLVEEERVTFRFEALRGKFLAGNYFVRVQVRLSDQRPAVLEKLGSRLDSLRPADLSFRVGTTQEALDDKKMVRKKLASVIKQLQSAYQELVRTGDQTLSDLGDARATIPAEGAGAESLKTIVQNWTAFCREWHEKSFGSADANFREYREGFFAPLYPNGEGSLENVSVALHNLMASYWKDVSQKAGVEVPEYAQVPAVFPRPDLTLTLRSSAKAFSRALGGGIPSWPVMPTASDKKKGDK